MITGEYDYTDQEVYEMTCECPAYYSYNGGANTVLLEYMEYMEYCERHKILLFSQFTSMPDRLEERFQQEKSLFIN